MKNLSQKLASVVAAASAFLVNQPASAQTSQLGEDTGSQHGFADQLIAKGMFKVSAETGQIQLDQNSIIESLKLELAEKLKSQHLGRSDKEVYEQLIRNLVPESFAGTQNGSQLQTMEFNKSVSITPNPTSRSNR